MSKTKKKRCVGDKSIQDYIANNQKSFELGLLLGQTGTFANYFLTWIPIPYEDENQVPAKLQDVSLEWLITHALQVRTSLPGGVHMIGLYIISPHESRKTLDQCAPIVSALLFDQNQSEPGFVLHVNPSVAKTHMWQLPRTSAKTNSIQLDMKWEQDLLMTNFQSYESVFHLQLSFPVLPDTSSNTTSRDYESYIETALFHLQDQIQSSIGLLDEGKNSVTFCSPVPTIPRSKSEAEEPIMDIQGSIWCLAWVHKLETEHTVEWTKQDVLQNFKARMDYVLEDWTQQLDEWKQSQRSTHPPRFAGPDMLFLPRRSIVEWKSMPLSVYLFEQDDSAQALENLAEIYNFEPVVEGKQSFVIVEKEVYSAEMKHKLFGSSSKSRASVATDTDRQGMMSKLVLSGIILFVAILMALLFHNQLNTIL